MVANKDFTGFCNLSTASPSSQVCTGSETFNLNYSRRESSRMKLFQLVAFGSHIKWTAHGFLELTLWLKFGFINVDTTFRLPFKIIHECPVSVQAPTICVYQQVCKTLHIRIVPCFFFSLNWYFFISIKLTCQREVDENHPHYRKGKKAHLFGHFDLLEFYLQRYSSLLRQNSLESTRYSTKGEWNNRTLCLNVICVWAS